MDYNPFKSGATQETVQERTEDDCKGMVCKSCGDTYGKPTNEKCMYDSKDPNGKNWMEAEPETIDPVNKKELKGKHKDRKDKDIDNDGDVDSSDEYLHKRRKAISKTMEDTNKEGYFKDLEIKKQDKAMGAKPVPKKQDKAMGAKPVPKKKINASKSTDKEGDVSMNPKMDSEKKTEQKESRIRSALKSVLSEKKSDREELYKSATAPEKMSDKIKGKGAKDMMAAADAEIAKGPDAHLNEPEIDKKNFEKMTSNVKVAAKRKGDNPKGDTKIVAPGTPMKDPAAMKAESVSFAQSIQNMKNVYSEMNTPKVEKEINNERS